MGAHYKQHCSIHFLYVFRATMRFESALSTGGGLVAIQ